MLNLWPNGHYKSAFSLPIRDDGVERMEPRINSEWPDLASFVTPDSVQILPDLVTLPQILLDSGRVTQSESFNFPVPGFDDPLQQVVHGDVWRSAA